VAFNILIQLLGIICGSTAIIFIKLSPEQPFLLSAYRLLIAALALTPLFLRDVRKHREFSMQTLLGVAMLPGIALAAHFISWIIGARMTTAVNATLLVTLTPVVMPFLLFFMIQERITSGEFWGTVLSIGGVAILSVGDFNFSRQYFWGDMICLLSMLFYSYYLVISRKNRRIPSIWLYVVPLYWIAGLVCFVSALFFVNPVKAYTLREGLLILGLGLIPTVIGHSILNYIMQVQRGQLASIINMGHFFFAGVFAYIFIGELPRNNFYVASILIVIGAWLAMIKIPHIQRRKA
jgi:drug/metabolite transporter (DMT)-like permease